MLPSLSTALLSLAVVALPGILAEEQPAAKDVVSIQTAAAEPPKAVDDSSPKSTIFNGLEVPPLKQLTEDDFGKETSKGYWFVKYHSPYCHHCRDIAPVWQTLYEFYYTSAPVPSSKSSLNAFHPFYDFHFGSIDCIAYGSACEARHVNSWPTFLLYKDGVVAKKYTGTKDLQGFSNFVEEILESIRPGSRPKDGVKLPEVGDESVDVNAKPDSPAAKDKDTAAGSAAGEKHNDIAQKEPGSSPDTGPTKADEPTETGKTEKPSRPSDNANPSGTSVRLAAESFQDLVTTTQDAWFIKFYAPWCPHCQMMAPNWEELGREMKGKLRVGEVNCDIESRLCKDVQVKAFPTIIYFKGGERIEYEGLRGLGDLVNFAQKALDVGEEVRYVDAAAFKKLEETEEVIFLYLYDHATTTEDFAAMDRVRLSLIGHAKLVKSNDAILSDRFKISTWPRLLVSRDGRPSYYQALAPRDMRDFRKVVGWMKSVWLPIVPELTGANAREIMDGRYVVLGILSRDRPNEFVGAKREIKNAALEWMDRETDAFRRERQELRDAKQLRIEEAEDRGDQRALRAAKTSRIDMEAAARKEVRFAWVDGVFWERWIRTTYGIAVSDGGRVIINDEENRRYWDNTISGASIMPSRTSILETLPKVLASPPKITAKSTTSSVVRVFMETRKATRKHPYLGSAILVVLLAVLAIWGRTRIRRGRGATGFMNGSGSGPGFFKLDGKDGLLGGVGLGGGGGGQNGKVD
ncbi:MAG: hypothetical protein M1815_003065 [Lichina confinis]|nr:MAG: hypothetical protein M1815_003065 [Lichina confinis]